MTGSPTTNKADCHWWVPKVAFYDMLGEQLHNCNPVKYGHAICLSHIDEGIPLSALRKYTTSKLAGLFSTQSIFYAERQAGKP